MTDDGVHLDPADQFDAVLIKMIETNRRKRADYAKDADIFSNFRGVAEDLGLTGFGPTEAAYSLLLTKVNRLKSLRSNGRMDDARNEAVTDTYLDLAVYAVIVVALASEPR